MQEHPLAQMQWNFVPCKKGTVIKMLKYTYEQVLSDQAEQVNTKRNNTNNLTAYGQKMINDSNIINMIPKNKDIRAV